MSHNLDLTCCVCGRGPANGVALFRANAKGVAGVWVCAQHMAQTDAPPPGNSLKDLVGVIESNSDDGDE